MKNEVSVRRVSNGYVVATRESGTVVSETIATGLERALQEAAIELLLAESGPDEHPAGTRVELKLIRPKD